MLRFVVNFFYYNISSDKSENVQVLWQELLSAKTSFFKKSIVKLFEIKPFVEQRGQAVKSDRVLMGSIKGNGGGRTNAKGFQDCLMQELK